MHAMLTRSMQGAWYAPAYEDADKEHAMTEAENEALGRGYIDAVHQRNLDQMIGMIAPNFVEHLADEAVKGPEGIRARVDTLLTAFPDLQVTIDPLVSSGDQVAVRITYRGTHQGELQGIAPAGNDVAFSATALGRIEGGQLVEQRTNLDELGLMQQIGSIPVEAQN